MKTNGKPSLLGSATNCILNQIFSPELVVRTSTRPRGWGHVWKVGLK